MHALVLLVVVGTTTFAATTTTKKHICFHTNQAWERGTEVALYDYADWLEKLYPTLYTSSILFPRKPDVLEGLALGKFKRRFPVNFYDVEGHVRAGSPSLPPAAKALGCDLLYIIKGGGMEWDPVYPQSFLDANNVSLVPTAVHAVFAPWEPHGTVYVGIGVSVTGGVEGRPLVPHMVPPPESKPVYNATYVPLREELGINRTAFVLCRIGGRSEFNIDFVHETLVDLAERHSKDLFSQIFMSTDDFTVSVAKKRAHQAAASENGTEPALASHHDYSLAGKNSSIHFLPGSSDADKKERFFDACDAMIHARIMGETFGLAVGEFSVRNKPVLTYSGQGSPSHDIEHIKILNKTAFVYNDKQELIKLVENFIREGVPPGNYNAYTQYLPVTIMERFKRVFLDPVFRNDTGSDSANQGLSNPARTTRESLTASDPPHILRRRSLLLTLLLLLLLFLFLFFPSI